MRNSAFSLIELVVVVALIATMVALLLPSVQVARESSRAVSCRNNLKQLGLALGLHVSTTGRFPSGGWGHEWTGMPDRGSGKRQPGGWVYSSLSYLEHTELHQLGSDLLGAAADAAYSVRLTTPISTYVCPTRRSSTVWPLGSSHAGAFRPYGHASEVAKCDYAINGGVVTVASFSGPADLAIGDSETYWKSQLIPETITGVCHLRTSVPIRQIRDGMSCTYLIGEKMISPANYENGQSTGDNDSMFTGFSNDFHRYSGNLRGSSPWVLPLADGPENVDPVGYLRFGGPHSSGVLMANCDGSVQSVAFDVDPLVHLRAGHRSDDGKRIEELK